MTTILAKDITHLLDKEQRQRFIVLVLQMIFVAFLEFTGIALVLPFIKIVGEEIDIAQLPSIVSNILGGQNKQELMVSIGIAIFVLIVISTILKIYLSWREQKFVWEISHKLGLQQHKNIIAKPYSFFIEKNSSDIITTLIVETSTTVRGVLLPIAQIISNTIIALLFLSLITILHPKISFILISISAIVGFIIILTLKKKLQELGQERLTLERSRFLQLKESIIGIKTVKSSQKEPFFLEKFEKVSSKYSTIKPFVNTLSTIPKNVLDIILFGGVILLVTVLMYRGNDVTTILPSLTFYVFVGFKLLPTFQNIINSIITIRFSWPSLKAVFASLESNDALPSIQTTKNELTFNHTLKLSSCSFSHQPGQQILNDVTIEILKGQKVGIVGYSGSGKTTLVEILSGLLKPTKGSIFLDDEEIGEHNLSSIMQLIAFVPQDVFFFDDTILKNLTLEENTYIIDQDKLARILDLLTLKDFVKGLKNGLNTKVGEYGIKLSGGQKQRLGFARALYKDPAILILDESTSALDYLTEKELLENLRIHFPSLTIIKVAHRLKSVYDCDNIYFLDKGTLMATGTFEEITQNNSLFKEMVNAGTI